jgi:hypothetical protein
VTSNPLGTRLADVGGWDAAGRLGRGETAQIAWDTYRWVDNPVISEDCNLAPDHTATAI